LLNCVGRGELSQGASALGHGQHKSKSRFYAKKDPNLGLPQCGYYCATRQWIISQYDTIP